MRTGSGVDVNPPVIVRAPMVVRRRLPKWLMPDDRMQPWIDAFLAIDQRRDKTLLLELLKSTTPIPRAARWHLADLLERYELKNPRGRRKTPSYDRSVSETRLIWAKESVVKFRSEGISRDQAIQRAARIYGVTDLTLRNYLEGKDRSARRMASRRPPVE